MSNRLRTLALTTALTAPFTLGACSGALDAIQPGHALSPEQTTALDSSFRLGRMGLEAYSDALEAETDMESMGGFTEFTDTNLKTFPGMAIPLGQALRAGSDLLGSIDGEPGSASDEMTIMPVSTPDGSSVAFASTSGNMTYQGSESLTLVHPDPNFFKDTTASPEEMQAFYQDPRTVVSAAKYFNDDVLNGEKDFSAKRSGDILRIKFVRTDLGQDESPDFDKVDPVKVIRNVVLYES